MNGGAGLTAPPDVALGLSRTAMAALEWEVVNPIHCVPSGCLVL